MHELWLPCICVFSNSSTVWWLIWMVTTLLPLQSHMKLFSDADFGFLFKRNVLGKLHFPQFLRAFCKLIAWRLWLDNVFMNKTLIGSLKEIIDQIFFLFSL